MATNVAPFMGAWIETMRKTFRKSCLEVAPFMGAWIETDPFVTITEF